MTQKTFDSVELQRNLRLKLVEEADYDLNAFFQLIQQKKKNSPVYQKLSQRIEAEKNLIAV